MSLRTQSSLPIWNYNEVLEDNNVTDYAFYHAYSLCKLKVIYELSKKHPEAGAFAPCSMSIFHKKDSNTTNIVSLNINALISTLALKDKALIKMLTKTQGEMQNILKDAIEQKRVLVTTLLCLFNR